MVLGLTTFRFIGDPPTFLRMVKNFIWTGDINKQDFVTINWSIICNTKSEGGLQVVNFQLKIKAYHLRLAWDFAYNYHSLISLMKARFLKFKYQRVWSFFSSSIWLDINDWYDVILEHIFFIIRRGDNINF